VLINTAALSHALVLRPTDFGVGCTKKAALLVLIKIESIVDDSRIGDAQYRGLPSDRRVLTFWPAITILHNLTSHRTSTALRDQTPPSGGLIEGIIHPKLFRIGSSKTSHWLDPLLLS
jgi:hypothetical protein